MYNVLKIVCVVLAYKVKRLHILLLEFEAQADFKAHFKCISSHCDDSGNAV